MNKEQPRYLRGRGGFLLLLVGLASCLAVVMGCSSTLKYTVVASGDLHMENGVPHTLDLRIYQFKEEGDFKRAQPNRSWTSLCGHSYKRDYVLGEPVKEQIYPGETIEGEKDLEGECKYLGVVACYSGKTLGRTTYAVFPKDGGGSKLVIHLGSRQIEEISGGGSFSGKKSESKLDKE